MTENPDLEVVYGHREYPLLHMLAPVATVAVVWAAKEVIEAVYGRVTGRTPPVPSDPRTSWGRALLWTAATTTSAALIEVSIRRLANQRQIIGFRVRAR